MNDLLSLHRALITVIDAMEPEDHAAIVAKLDGLTAGELKSLATEMGFASAAPANRREFIRQAFADRIGVYRRASY